MMKAAETELTICNLMVRLDVLERALKRAMPNDPELATMPTVYKKKNRTNKYIIRRRGAK